MGEVRDPSWPPAALRAQAVAARTYAMRAMSVGGELCDTTRCQVYLGQQAEYPAMDKAVKDSAGQVLSFGGHLASAVYSSNGGGHSASREEGFGTTGGEYPYLRPAPYDTKNPMPWTVVVALSDVAARSGHLAVDAVTVTETGPSGRALSVTLDGPAGRRSLTGRAFAAALGLRSTMFTARLAVADAAPPPLSAGAALQDLPDELAPPPPPADATGPLVARAGAALDPVTADHVVAAPLHARPSEAGLARALGELVLAVAAMLAVSWRRAGAGAGGPTRRSSRGARRAADANR
jgi:stage II sporulation protein D